MDLFEDSDRSKISVRFFWKFCITQETSIPLLLSTSVKIYIRKGFRKYFWCSKCYSWAYIRLTCDEPQRRGSWAVSLCAGNSLDLIALHSVTWHRAVIWCCLGTTCPRPSVGSTYWVVHIQTENNSWWDFSLWRRRICRWLSSGMLHRVI
jgi:hypothetical protein